MPMDEVEILDSKIVIIIPYSKTEKEGSLRLACKGNINPVMLFRKYLALRPSHVTTKRLFISYRIGKCTIQLRGIHFISEIPERFFTYLKP